MRGEAQGGEKKAIRLWEEALCFGGGVLALAWSLHQESRTILGAWRGAIGVSSESDQIRPLCPSDLLCVIPMCSFWSVPCAFIPIGIWLSDPIIKSGAEKTESSLSWRKLWEIPFPTLGKVDQGRCHGKGETYRPKWKPTDSLGASILVLTWDSAVTNVDALFYTQPSLLPSSSYGAERPPVFPSSTSKCTGSLLRPAWKNNLKSRWTSLIPSVCVCVCVCLRSLGLVRLFVTP